MINKFSLKQLDNFHIVLWLMKDIFWVREEQFWGVLMIMPTVSVAMILTIQSIHQKQGFYSNFAILCWMLADSIWMVDEFFILEIQWITLGLFILGILSMVYYYIVICNIFKINFMTRLRLLKFES